MIAVLSNTKGFQISFQFCYCHLSFWILVRWAECGVVLFWIFLTALLLMLPTLFLGSQHSWSHGRKDWCREISHPQDVSAYAFRTAGSCHLQFVCETSNFVVWCLSHWKGCVCVSLLILDTYSVMIIVKSNQLIALKVIAFHHKKLFHLLASGMNLDFPGKLSEVF